MSSLNDRMDVSELLNLCVTKQELLELLEDVDDDTPIMFACGYGNLGDTQQVIPITKMEDTAEDTRVLVESGYSTTGIAYIEERAYDLDLIDEHALESMKHQPIVVLS